MIRTLILSIAVLFPGAAISFAQSRDPEAVPLDAQIVLMGELHDVDQHHLNQAEWVARMAPAAVVFEMLPPDLGPVATRRQSDPPRALGEALQWSARGWGDFAAYAPIFAAAGGARIYGGGVPRADVGRAMADGAAALMPGRAATYGLDLPLPLEEQAAREDLQFDAHCGALPPEMLPGMVEVQRLRDAALADAALTALDDTGGPVAVITGNGHARTDWGIPFHLGFARPEVTVVAIGQGLFGDADAPFDHWVVGGTRPADAPDPCAAFQ